MRNSSKYLNYDSMLDYSVAVIIKGKRTKKKWRYGGLAKKNNLLFCCTKRDWRDLSE